MVVREIASNPKWDADHGVRLIMTDPGIVPAHSTSGAGSELVLP